MADGAVYLGYTPAQLDRQYNPRLSVPDFQAYFDRWARDSAKARRSPGAERNIAYGRGKTDKLDIYRPAGKGPHPVLVYFHGGWWRAFSKDDRAYLAPWLTGAGVMLVIVDYALLPTVTMDQLIAQCRRSLVWVGRHIREHGGDPERIFIAGESAGGHIVAMLASTYWTAEGVAKPPQIRGALAISGVYDLEPFPHTFLQPDLRLTPEQVDRNSPIRHVRKSPTQIMLAVGLDESAELQRQLEAYGAALGRAGMLHDIVRAGGRNHFSIMDCLADPKHMLRQSLMRMMRP